MQVNKAYYPHTGGVEKHVQDVAEALHTFTDVDVSVMVASEDRRTTSGSMNGVPITRLANYLTLSSTPIAPSFFWRLRGASADIYHFHFPYPFAELAYLATKPKGALVVTYHSDIVRQKRLLGLYRPFLERFLAKAAVILTSSPNMIENSVFLRPLREKCRVVPFAIDVDRFAATPEITERARIRRKEYAGDGPLILFVGRLVYYKGLNYLIDAMRQVNATLVIVGEGDLYSDLIGQVEVDGLRGKVRFVGGVEQDELVSLYHACDLLVLPSVATSEAFGFVQLEAHACGKPVVSTNLPTGVPYANLDGVTGSVVPPRDSNALAGSINSLLEDEPLRHRLGEQARQRVREQFTPEAMAAAMVAAYETALEREQK